MAVLAAGSVQYIENTQVKNLLADMNENTLLSPSLAYEKFFQAAMFATTMSRVNLIKDEKLVKLACETLQRRDTEREVKAVAAFFLQRLWEFEDARPLILAHLDMTSLANLFVKQYQSIDYEQSVQLVMAAAFDSRTPNADKDAQMEERRKAHAEALPYILLGLIGAVLRDQASSDQDLELAHRQFVSTSALKHVLQFFRSSEEPAMAAPLLYALSTSEFGRRTLLEENAFSSIRDVAFDPASPTYTKLHSNDNAKSLIELAGTQANLYRYNLAELNSRYPHIIGTLKEEERKDMEVFEMKGVKASLETTQQLQMVSGAIITSVVYASARAIVRKYWRGFLPNAGYLSTALGATGRAVVVSPLLILGGFAYQDLRFAVHDDRLFISYTVLSTAAAAFLLRSAMLIAPFSFVPAAFGVWSVKGAATSERVAREKRLDEFRRKNRTPSILDEL